MSLKDIEISIRKYVPDAIMEPIYIDSLGRELLFVSTALNIRSLKVFDSNRGIDNIAEIRYNMSKASVYISSFVVNEEYQQNGIGRLIFEFVMAHADRMGASRLSGTADPTDPIKGVSTGKDEDYEKEVEAVKTIYRKLGCKFIDDKHFVQTWEPKSRINKINPQFRKMIEESVKKDISVM